MGGNQTIEQFALARAIRGARARAPGAGPTLDPRLCARFWAAYDAVVAGGAGADALRAAREALDALVERWNADRARACPPDAGPPAGNGDDGGW